MGEAIASLFDNNFMPHGHCYFWRADILWLNVVSDALIVLSYIAIPTLLLLGLRKVKDLPYRWIFRMFSAFIFFCGVTHIFDIIVVWSPLYQLQGFVKAATAAISVATVIMMLPLLPRLIEAFRGDPDSQA